MLKLFELGGQGTPRTTGSIVSLAHDIEAETISAKTFSTHQFKGNTELNNPFPCVIRQQEEIVTMLKFYIVNMQVF